RPRLGTAMLLAILGRLKDREQASVLSKAVSRSSELESVLTFEEKAHDAQKQLSGKKKQAPIDAYRFLEKLPLEQVAYLLAESNTSMALYKIRAYLHKWLSTRKGLPMVGNDVESWGIRMESNFDI